MAVTADRAFAHYGSAHTQTTLIRVCDHLLVAYDYDTTRYVALQFTDRLDFTTSEMRHAAMSLGLSVWSLTERKTQQLLGHTTFGTCNNIFYISQGSYIWNREEL